MHSAPMAALSAGPKSAAPKLGIPPTLGAFACVIDITLSIASVSAITASADRRE
jgi:hypothetical protein